MYLLQLRAAFFTQRVAPYRVELSDEEDDDSEGEDETAYARCSTRTKRFAASDGQGLERSLRTNVTHRVSRMESLRVSPVWWS